MALSTRGSSGSKKTFLNVYQGNIVLEYDSKESLESKLDSLGVSDNDKNNIKVRQKTKGKNEGKDVFYFELDSLSGTLTNIEIDEKSFGEIVQLTFKDVDEEYTLSLADVFTRLTKDLVRRLGNLDLDQNMSFGLWSISAEESENGKSSSGVKIYQDGTDCPEMKTENKIEYSISWEDLPEPVQKRKGKTTTWDYSDQEAFIYESLESYIKNNFSSEKITNKAPSNAPPVTSASDAESDDLPF